MRALRLGAFVTWLVVAGLAVAGFAAFSPKPVQEAVAPLESAAAPHGTIAANRGATAGRIAALAFAVGTRDLDTPVDSIVAAEPAATLARTIVEPSLDDPPRANPVATTTATTAASAPPSTTTRPETPSTTAPPATTAPTTTTTTAPPSEEAPPEEAPQPIDDSSGLLWPSGSTCKASWYGPGFEGRPTASGEPFDPAAMTGALHDVPFDTMVTVTRVDTGASVTIRINDRGPYVWDDGWKQHPTRCIDLSEAAMAVIAGKGAGIVDVTISY